MEIKGERLRLNELIDPPHELIIGIMGTIGDDRDPVEITPVPEILPVELDQLSEIGRSHKVPLFDRVPVEVTPLFESEPVKVDPVEATDPVRLGEWTIIVRSENRLTSGVWIMRKWSV